MSIIIALAVLVVLSIAAFAAWRLSRALKASSERGTLPGQGDEERPQHVALGTSDQLTGIRRARERATADRR